jgi:hypothetical protein
VRWYRLRKRGVVVVEVEVEEDEDEERNYLYSVTTMGSESSPVAAITLIGLHTTNGGSAVG